MEFKCLVVCRVRRLGGGSDCCRVRRLIHWSLRVFLDFGLSDLCCGSGVRERVSDITVRQRRAHVTRNVGDLLSDCGVRHGRRHVVVCVCDGLSDTGGRGCVAGRFTAG